VYPFVYFYGVYEYNDRLYYSSHCTVFDHDIQPFAQSGANTMIVTVIGDHLSPCGSPPVTSCHPTASTRSMRIDRVLSFRGSMLAWSRVYFYGFVWTIVSLVFFASPGKAKLRALLEKRQGKVSARLVRSISTDSLTGKDPILGISKDLERDVNEAVEEIRAEVEARQRKKTG